MVEEELKWKFSKNEMLVLLPRYAGCVPFSYEAEEYAKGLIEIWEKDLFDVVDLFSVFIKTSKKYNEEISLKSLRVALSENVIKTLLDLAEERG